MQRRAGCLQSMEPRTGGGGIPLTAEDLRWSCTGPVPINLALNGETVFTLYIEVCNTFQSTDQNWFFFIGQYTAKIKIISILEGKEKN